MVARSHTFVTFVQQDLLSWTFSISTDERIHTINHFPATYAKGDLLNNLVFVSTCGPILVKNLTSVKIVHGHSVPLGLLLNTNCHTAKKNRMHVIYAQRDLFGHAIWKCTNVHILEKNHIIVIIALARLILPVISKDTFWGTTWMRGQNKLMQMRNLMSVTCATRVLQNCVLFHYTNIHIMNFTRYECNK